MAHEADQSSASLLRQHLIDPETCIRCNTCESRCPTKAISHGDNYVVDPELCNGCMRCIRPCPTGAVDHWFEVERAFSVADQATWRNLPRRSVVTAAYAVPQAYEDEAVRIMENAHEGAEGLRRAPPSSSKPQVNIYDRRNHATASVTTNLRVTTDGGASDVHHLVLDFGSAYFPILEGQSIGLLPPGLDQNGQPHAMRLYSVASPRDGEKPNTNTLAITVKRTTREVAPGVSLPGVASSWLCDSNVGQDIRVVGPYGSTFLMPEDPAANLIMVCTGTGIAPFRGFILRRRRIAPNSRGKMVMFFGARSRDELPYFATLQASVANDIQRELVFSRAAMTEREYVQDRLLRKADLVGELLQDTNTYIYACGLKGLDAGLRTALTSIAQLRGESWEALENSFLQTGRLHVETY